VNEAIEHAKAQAIKNAIASGAEASTVAVVEIDTLPIPYVSGHIRVMVKAVGDLSLDHISDSKKLADADDDVDEGITENLAAVSSSHPAEESTVRFDFDSYKPKIVAHPTTGILEWFVSETDLAWLRDGCYILGCAGGGSPKSEFLRLRDQLRAGCSVRIVDHSSLSEDALIYCES